MAGKKNLLTRKATYIQFNKIIGAWVYEQTSGAGILHQVQHFQGQVMFMNKLLELVYLSDIE
ncbi:MAG: hypothetical protein GX198_04455 [Epulopiscium sp.]|nr:hypothetical protein [Candidatus Epulonipiscium sp.]